MTASEEHWEIALRDFKLVRRKITAGPWEEVPPGAWADAADITPLEPRSDMGVME